jgi:lysozyme
MSESSANSNVDVDISNSQSEYDKQLAIKNACEFIAKFEGCKLESYQDSAKVWTIGYGHTKDVRKGMQITQEQAELFLQDDTLFFYKNVLELVGSICNANQITALTSFSFNVGINGLKKSTLLKVIKQNPQNFTEIRKEFMRWVYADGKILNGLKTRRKAEADLFEGISTGAGS